MTDDKTENYQHIFIEAIPEVDHVAPLGMYHKARVTL